MDVGDNDVSGVAIMNIGARFEFGSLTLSSRRMFSRIVRLGCDDKGASLGNTERR